MPNAQGRYPLSTADGKSIPLDAVRPQSFLPLALLSTAGSSTKQVPTDIELMTVMTTVDCYLQFTAEASVVDAFVVNTAIPDTLFIPAGLHIVISPPIDKTYFSARAMSATGMLFVQFLESWTGLTLQSRINRR